MTWAKVLKAPTSQAVTWMIPVFTPDGSQNRPLPETHRSSGDAALNQRLRFDAAGFATLEPLACCCASLMLIKGFMPAGAVSCWVCCSCPRPTRPVLCWPSASQNDEASGFQTTGDKGFLDLIVLHVRKKQAWTPNDEIYDKMSQKVFKFGAELQSTWVIVPFGEQTHKKLKEKHENCTFQEMQSESASQLFSFLLIYWHLKFFRLEKINTWWGYNGRTSWTCVLHYITNKTKNSTVGEVMMCPGSTCGWI